MRFLCLLLLLGLPQEDPRIPALLERLREDDIEVREKAAADLVELGRAALPAVDRLRASSEPDLRARGKALAKAIADAEVVGRHWRRGARANVEVDRVPVAKVLEELSKKYGEVFKGEAVDLQDPVTFRLRDATFWEALEALCRAAPALTWSPESDGIEVFHRRRPPYPSVRSGEFNVWLDGITVTREQDFTVNSRTAFAITIMSAWERGIAPVAVEQRIVEVLDESGVSLYSSDRVPFASRLESSSGRFRRDELRSPLPPGVDGIRRLKRVRGNVLFIFPRAYEELLLDVQAPMSPRTSGGVTVTVRNYRMVKDTCHFEVIVTAQQVAGEPMIDRLPFREVVVVDDQGGTQRPTSSSRSHSYGGSTFTIHENLQVVLPEGRRPATLKLRLLKETMEKRVPFEFADISVE